MFTSANHTGTTATLEAEVSDMLKAAGVDHTYRWYPSSHSGLLSHKVTVCVLPRHISVEALTDTVHRIRSLKLKLCGGEVEVHAPNIPSLALCKECSQLGHGGQACPIYGGIAVRLLFKSTVSFPALQQLQADTGARSAYLGNSTSQMLPHRVVTLLFGAELSDPQRLVERMEPTMRKWRHALHEAPRQVDPKDRQRECRECGSLVKPHTCPFAPPSLVGRIQHKGAVQSAPPAGAQAQPQQGGAAPAAPGTAAATAAWRTPACSWCASCFRSQRWQRSRLCTGWTWHCWGGGVQPLSERQVSQRRAVPLRTRAQAVFRFRQHWLLPPWKFVHLCAHGTNSACCTAGCIRSWRQCSSCSWCASCSHRSCFCSEQRRYRLHFFCTGQGRRRTQAA